MAWIDSLFKRMAELDASDLHLSSNRQPMLRLHGDMVPVEGAPVLEPKQMQQVLFEICPKGNREQFEAECDTDFAYHLAGVGRFRCNYFMDSQGPGAVFRVIPEEILTAEQLNLPQSIIDMCYLTKGLVLVTGPTGSGKSTTLAAMVDHINKNRSDHIITIEDPIEFVHQDQKCLLNQREVGEHTGSFKRALRAALREDPDIVLVGEMRDLETIEIAIETAETGHLVFGTLHTSTAASTVDRIIDQFPADRQAQIRTMLSSSLKGVVAQTLCKKIGGGRCAALEILVVNSGISNQIREGKTHQISSQMQMGAKQGMRLLNDSLIELVQAEKVEPEQAWLKAVDKDGIEAQLSAIGMTIDKSKIARTGPAPDTGGTTPTPKSPLPAQGSPETTGTNLGLAEQPSAPLPAEPQPEPEPAPETSEETSQETREVAEDPFLRFKQQRGL